MVKPRVIQSAARIDNGGVALVTRREGNSPPRYHEKDAGMDALADLFSCRKITNRAHFRCSFDGPTDLELLLESVLDEVFGRNPSSAYKCWVRKLHRLGLISTMPKEWKASTDPEN